MGLRPQPPAHQRLLTWLPVPTLPPATGQQQQQRACTAFHISPSLGVPISTATVASTTVPSLPSPRFAKSVPSAHSGWTCPPAHAKHLTPASPLGPAPCQPQHPLQVTRVTSVLASRCPLLHPKMPSAQKSEILCNQISIILRPQNPRGLPLPWARPERLGKAREARHGPLASAHHPTPFSADALPLGLWMSGCVSLAGTQQGANLPGWLLLPLQALVMWPSAPLH